jgi:hypothetical protein
MDPNANLTEQLEIAALLLNDDPNNAVAAIRLAELVEALDGWLKGGGFLPDAWGKL